MGFTFINDIPHLSVFFQNLDILRNVLISRENIEYMSHLSLFNITDYYGNENLGRFKKYGFLNQFNIEVFSGDMEMFCIYDWSTVVCPDKSLTINYYNNKLFFKDDGITDYYAVYKRGYCYDDLRFSPTLNLGYTRYNGSDFEQNNVVMPNNVKESIKPLCYFCVKSFSIDAPEFSRLKFLFNRQGYTKNFKAYSAAVLSYINKLRICKKFWVNEAKKGKNNMLRLKLWIQIEDLSDNQIILDSKKNKKLFKSAKEMNMSGCIKSVNIRQINKERKSYSEVLKKIEVQEVKEVVNLKLLKSDVKRGVEEFVNRHHSKRYTYLLHTCEKILEKDPMRLIKQGEKISLNELYKIFITHKSKMKSRFKRRNVTESCFQDMFYNVSMRPKRMFNIFRVLENLHKGGFSTYTERDIRLLKRLNVKIKHPQNKIIMIRSEGDHTERNMGKNNLQEVLVNFHDQLEVVNDIVEFDKNLRTHYDKLFEKRKKRSLSWSCDYGINWSMNVKPLEELVKGDPIGKTLYYNVVKRQSCAELVENYHIFYAKYSNLINQALTRRDILGDTVTYSSIYDINDY